MSSIYHIEFEQFGAGFVVSLSLWNNRVFTFKKSKKEEEEMKTTTNETGL